ncbi:MAG: hypothetical protein J1F32_01365 [Erysipelotrichales bacterium]|nr:hypothetical protein [Erysipelotrichales bacterium]
MKKIENDFLQDFDNSLENQGNFDNIKGKINFERFDERKKRNTFSFSYKQLGFVGAFVFLFAITLPIAISITNSKDISGSQTEYIPNAGQSSHSNRSDDDGQGNKPDENTPQTPPTGAGDNDNDNDNANDAKIRTVINASEPTLPHFLAAEVDKNVSIENEYLDINVFIGHDFFKNEVTFSEFVLTKQELENYEFVLVFNYNNDFFDIVENNIDYLNSDYNITHTINNGIEVVNFHKVHNLALSKEKMIDKNYGFVNVELYLTPLNSDEKYIVSAATIYYSITKNDIIFGLKENPVLHEGESGSVSSGWNFGN